MIADMDNQPAVPSPAKTDDDVYHQSISVSFEYPVHFTRDVFSVDNPLLAETLQRHSQTKRIRAVAYVDAGVDKAHPSLRGRIKEYFHQRQGRLELAGAPVVVPGGEQAKNDWNTVRDVMWTIGNLHLDRHNYVIVVGGGAVLDMVGFAASIVHRGLRLVRVPTTVLAQNDAGIGVKNGMDEHGQKNFVGTFAPPFAVLNDLSLLETLPQAHWVGGIAEAFKVAIIADAGFFNFLCDHASRLRGRDSGAMEQAIRRCARLHLDHIRTNGDPFEFGSARPLDFGHWAGHKLEVLSGYRLGHGQAVAVGIAVDSYYAMRHSLLTAAEFERIVSAMIACGLPVFSPLLARKTSSGTLEILEGLEQFREHLGGVLNVTLPNGLGSKVEVHQMSPEIVEDAVTSLTRRFGRNRT